MDIRVSIGALTAFVLFANLCQAQVTCAQADLDDNCSVDTSDIQTVIYAGLGIALCTECDLNADGKVSVADAMAAVLLAMPEMCPNACVECGVKALDPTDGVDGAVHVEDGWSFGFAGAANAGVAKFVIHHPDKPFPLPTGYVETTLQTSVGPDNLFWLRVMDVTCSDKGTVCSVTACGSTIQGAVNSLPPAIP